VKETQGDS